MAIHYRTLGIVLKKENRGEADQLFTVYTKEFGKIEILGKAIRKIKSKLRAGMELFYFSEIEFIQGKTHKTLTDVFLIDKFSNLRSDLNRLRLAYRISEVFDKLILGQESDKKIWLLLIETFKNLNNWKVGYSLGIENWKLKIIYYYFFWNLLVILGYQPELYNCIVCQKPLKPQKNFFGLREGGTVCNNCKKNVKLITEISPELIKTLRVLIQGDWQIFKKLKIEKLLFQEIKKISDIYFSFLKNHYS